MCKQGLISFFSMAMIVLLILACQPGTVTENKVGEANTAYLEEITITQLQKGYQDGTFTISKVVKDYLTRIEALDKNGPQLNSIITINPKAVEIAEQLEKELAQGKRRGPLHGIPVIIKDNIDTHDMPTTAGAIVLLNSFPVKDSKLVEKLRDAGAVIIAKANLSEWANFRSELSSSGWSGVGGQTKNPYVLDRNPCGSSSGSGTAAAANLCAIAIGTETDGSIVCPSNNNGLVGLKPTVGLISRSGIIPISFTQDTAGPMGRTVEDVAVCLGALTGVDSTDSRTIESVGKFKTDYTPYLKLDGLKGKRIGFLKSMLGFHSKVDTLMMQAVAQLKNQGAEVIEVQIPELPETGKNEYQVLLYEFKDGLNNYFASLGENAPIKNIEELIAFNQSDSIELQYFDQKILIQAQAKGDLTSKEYQEALSSMLKATRINGIDKVMNENKLDALLAPTGSPAWKTDLIDGDHFLGGSSSLAAISGYPNITVPMGYVDALPVGLSFFGRAWSEPLLLEIAYGYEQSTRHRKSPKYIPSR